MDNLKNDLYYVRKIQEDLLTSYRLWVESGKKMPLDDVINMTNRIVLGGVNGFFK